MTAQIVCARILVGKSFCAQKERRRGYLLTAAAAAAIPITTRRQRQFILRFATFALHHFFAPLQSIATVTNCFPLLNINYNHRLPPTPATCCDFALHVSCKFVVSWAICANENRWLRFVWATQCIAIN